VLEGLKLIGYMLIALAGIFECAKIINAGAEKAKLAEALYELISEIKSKIESFCLPIPEILSEIPKELLIKCGYSENSLPKNSEELIDKCTFKDDKELYSRFYEFVYTLGKNYKTEETAKCTYMAQSLEKIRKERKEEQIKSRKTIPAVCLSLSAGIIILLI